MNHSDRCLQNRKGLSRPGNYGGTGTLKRAMASDLSEADAVIENLQKRQKKN